MPEDDNDSDDPTQKLFDKKSSENLSDILNADSYSKNKKPTQKGSKESTKNKKTARNIKNIDISSDSHNEELKDKVDDVDVGFDKQNSYSESDKNIMKKLNRQHSATGEKEVRYKIVSHYFCHL